MAGGGAAVTTENVPIVAALSRIKYAVSTGAILNDAIFVAAISRYEVAVIALLAGGYIPITAAIARTIAVFVRATWGARYRAVVPSLYLA